MGQQKSKIISGEPEVKKKEKKKEPKTKVKKMEKPKSQKDSLREKVKVRSKKYQAIKKKLKIRSTSSTKKAIELLKEISNTPFDSTLEGHIALNLKPKETINLEKIKPDANGVIHLKLGKISDKTEKLSQKFKDLLTQIIKSKSSGKKDLIKSIVLCTTQSPAIKIDSNIKT